MAELNNESSSTHKQSRGRRSKKLSTRVDMTPMVDLGFLLITFFIFTASMIKPVSLEVEKPYEGRDGGVAESRTLTLMLGKDSKVYWYLGKNKIISGKMPELNTTVYSEQGLRKIIREKDKEVRKKTGYTNPEQHDYDKNGLIVIIKPLDNSIYKNIVDILDEMKLCDIETFAWAEASFADLELLKLKGLNL